MSTKLEVQQQAQDFLAKLSHYDQSSNATHGHYWQDVTRVERLLIAQARLLQSLELMVDVYWGKDGDGGREPRAIVLAKAAIAEAKLRL